MALFFSLFAVLGDWLASVVFLAVVVADLALRPYLRVRTTASAQRPGGRIRLRPFIVILYCTCASDGGADADAEL